MRQKSSPTHVIDFLFPVVLFLVFTISALTVILLAARIYQSTTERSSRNDTVRTSLSYLTEKLHQNDLDGNVGLGELEGCPALILAQEREDSTYYTYIYVYEKELKELFVKSGVPISPENGRTILPVEDFTITAVNDRLFLFTCTDENGNKASSLAAVHSGQQK